MKKEISNSGEPETVGVRSEGGRFTTTNDHGRPRTAIRSDAYIAGCAKAKLRVH